MKVAGIAAVAFFAGITAAPTAIRANDWFPFDRIEALARTRNAVEKLEKVAPIPDLKCKPNPTVLRYCSAPLTDRLKFQVVETYDTTAGIAAFQNGGPGKVYEIRVHIDFDGASSAELDMFDALCTASVLALRPKLSASAAARRYSSAMRRSMNRSKMNDSTVTIVGNPDTLITTASGSDLSCTVSAEDDYREQ